MKKFKFFLEILSLIFVSGVALLLLWFIYMFYVVFFSWWI
jgi:hypothetical protein